MPALLLCPGSPVLNRTMCSKCLLLVSMCQVCVWVCFCACSPLCMCRCIHVCVYVTVQASLINSRVFEQPKSRNLVLSSPWKLTLPECCRWKPPWESSIIYNRNQNSSKGIVFSDRILGCLNLSGENMLSKTIAVSESSTAPFFSWKGRLHKRRHLYQNFN